MTPLFEALMFQAGYNAALVAIGATLLGIAAGVTGTFLFLRKRALVSDAVAHATLPGIGLAFIIMVALGLDGRNLIVLMLGAFVTAVVVSSLLNGYRGVHAWRKMQLSELAVSVFWMGWFFSLSSRHSLLAARRDLKDFCWAPPPGCFFRMLL